MAVIFVKVCHLRQRSRKFCMALRRERKEAQEFACVTFWMSSMRSISGGTTLGLGFRASSTAAPEAE